MKLWQTLLFQIWDPLVFIFLVAALLLSIWPTVFFATKRRVNLGGLKYLGAVAAFVIFSLVGLSTGYLTGMSREAAISALVPAVLSLIAGSAAVFWQRDQAVFGAIGLAILGLSSSLLLGTVYGANNRYQYDLNMMSQRVKALYDVQHQAKIAKREAAIFEIRDTLGLPTEPFDTYVFFKNSGGSPENR